MQLIVAGLRSCMFIIPLMACQGPMAPAPVDIQTQTLDVKNAVRDADIIVLAEPVSQQDIRELSVPWQDRQERLRLAEMEITLRTLRVLKGPPILSEVRFRYYDGRGYVQSGPPQGPSGGMGAKGIFFLKNSKMLGGIYRSVVDLYRPDIPTGWIVGPIETEPCVSPSNCIATLLLTYHQFDDARSFSSHLLKSVAISSQIVGFLKTYELLDSLASEAAPVVISHEACLELSEWYALEFPPLCNAMISGTAFRDMMARAGKLRKELKNGGILWAQQQIGSKDKSELRRYLELLTKSPNEETRALAEALLKKLH